MFLPKRIRFLDRLPRSATGKIPAADLERLRALAGLGAEEASPRPERGNVPKLRPPPDSGR